MKEGLQTTRRRFLVTCALAVPALGICRPRTALASLTPGAAAVDLSFVENRLKLIRRAEWTSVMPRVSVLKDAGTFDRVTIHHSGGTVPSTTSIEDTVSQLDAIRTGHMDKGFGDIGYHFAVDFAGRVWEGRSLAYEGAHVSAQNERNIGIVLLGNFENQKPTYDQISAMETMVAAALERFSIKWNRVYGHCDLASSVCPGRNLYQIAKKLRQ